MNTTTGTKGLTEMERYVGSRVAWFLHCDGCRECDLARRYGDPTDCPVGDELRTRMDHFRLDAEVSRWR